MISLIDVTRYHGKASNPQIVLNQIQLRIDPMDRVGILAASGAGKSTLARIIAGSEVPDLGYVTCARRLSWPLGFSSAFHPNLTGAQNISLIGRLWNQDPNELVARVEDFAHLGALFHRPMYQLSPGQKSQIALSLSFNNDFDMYLADDMNVSANRHFRDKCDAALIDKLASAGLIMLSRHTRLIDQFATRFFVLSGADLIECDSTSQAQDILDLTLNEEQAPYAIA